MSKQCSSCGTPAPDDASVFCNRCGARLTAAGPAPVPVCRQCGAPVTDRLSQFCNRCGSPLVAEVRAAAPPARHAGGKVCPACGFENFGENLFYCKKCGSIFSKNEPARQGGVAGTTPARGSQKGPIRIVPDGMDELRQGPGNAAEAARQVPAGAPVLLRRPPATAAPGKPRKRMPLASPGWWKTGSNRTVIAVAVLVLVVIAVILVSGPGILNTGPAGETIPDVPGSPDSDSPDVPDSAAPDLPESVPWVNTPGRTPAINQAVPVFTDTISQDEPEVTDTIPQGEPDVTETISEGEPDVTETISEEELD